ncbi:hypothetical protein BB559_005196 [Furculomyces boomerangus]|uniref:Uncharacterized protein n=2 Tax=Harpellales TaxID=61421 RepID=A0A2T9YA44_9FUNG|nr:hypothetical protein BB559_005196 [Furculomyces boomerangus]PWA03685.1 hypothetical protein BB558_000143 [Smittium angustum]
MISLVTGLYSYINQQHEYCILTLGLAASGKTTIIEKIKNVYTGKPGMDPASIQPTIGLNIRNINIGKHRLKFMDLGGDDELHEIWKSYYTSCHGIMFIVDTCKPEILTKAMTTFENLMKSEELDGIPVAILGNKYDSENSLLPLEILKENVNKMADIVDNRSLHVFPVSGYTGDGLKYATNWMHQRMVERKDVKPPTIIKS